VESRLIEAQILAIIDQEIGEYTCSHAQYEIIRRVIYHTGDFEYQFLLWFSESVLNFGAAALAARTTIITDVSMVKAGITPKVQQTFFNPIYCAEDVSNRTTKNISQIFWGLHTLGRRYPEGIYILGQDEQGLDLVLEMMEHQVIKPALIIATPCGFVNTNEGKQKLKQSVQPHITTEERKGGAQVAVAIALGLIDLAWHAYEPKGDV